MAENAAEPQNEETAPETPIEDVAVELSTLDDAAIEAVITEATDAAQAATEAEVFDNDVFEAALARANAARTELNVRTERANQLASARSRAAELATLRPATPTATVVPRVADIVKPETVTPTPVRDGLSFSLIVPGDAARHVPGGTDNGRYASFNDLGHVLSDRATQMGSPSGSRSESFGLMSIKRHDSQFAVTGENIMNDMASIDRARDQKRLDGGTVLEHWRRSMVASAGGDERRVSLTAAAGWCAPSETYYDLCEMESMDGLIDLPEVTATRGGIRWTAEPTYAQMDAATGFGTLTEAQVIADTAKTCAEVPCPAFTDTRLNVAYTCITGSFLQLRGYPELMARWARGQMVVHAHKLNEAIIAALVAQAGAVTPIVLPAGDPITSALLSAVELAAEDIRYRNRLAFNSVIEIVLPHWVIPLIRADFTRRAFGDPGLTDARIVEWFTTRHVRPQFVYDWQDGYSGGGATFPGGDGTPPYIATLVPAGTAVQFLAYPAGAVVLARQDVINLRNVYDSTNLQQNLYTDTFFEEGWAPIYPCPDLRLYSALTCPSGATGAMIDLDCTP